MKKAFSLVELLVVIGIIAVLASVLLGTFSGGNEAARAARCLSNMKTLATGCQSYALAHGFYPTAGSLEWYTLRTGATSRRKRGNATVREEYSECPGWVSWNSQGAYVGAKPTSPKASAGWITSTYEPNDDIRHYCLTNGALWKYVSGNSDVYRCPVHVIQKTKPNWSYVMNPRFGWTAHPGNEVYQGDDGRVWYKGFERSDRFLLFAEMPFTDYAGVEIKIESGAGQACDCVLQYKGLDGASVTETIGFNHKSGRQTFANIVFADGHVEKLTLPKTGLSIDEQQKLTRWLCKGIDISFDGSQYKNLTKDE